MSARKSVGLFLVAALTACDGTRVGDDGGRLDTGGREDGGRDTSDGVGRDGGTTDAPVASMTDCAAVPCRYVREGAAGRGDGADWANAYPGLPATLERGVVYFLGDGVYEGRTFQDEEDGSRLITLVKATEAEHGTSVGWDAGYGDGQALFDASAFYRGYYLIDGRRRNEADWQDIGAYGIRFTTEGGYSIHIDEEGSSGVTSITFRYVDAGGDPAVPPNHGGGFRLVGPHTNIVISHAHIHHGGGMISRGPDEVTIEHCHVGPDFGKEAISHQDGDRWVIRHNRFIDNTAFVPAPLSEHGTAVIGVFDYSGGADLDPDTVFSDDWQIYGNVFAGTGDYDLFNSTGGTILAGNVHRWRVYNNTFSDLGGPWVGISLSGSDNLVRNSLIHRVGNYSETEAALIACTATSCEGTWCFENNPLYMGTARVDADCTHLPMPRLVGTADPFVDAANLDYRLRPGIAGPSPIDTGIALTGLDDRDAYGTRRGSGGGWDHGAFEHVAP